MGDCSTPKRPRKAERKASQEIPVCTCACHRGLILHAFPCCGPGTGFREPEKPQPTANAETRG